MTGVVWDHPVNSIETKVGPTSAKLFAMFTKHDIIAASFLRWSREGLSWNPLILVVKKL